MVRRLERRLVSRSSRFVLAICGCAVLAGAGRLFAEEPPAKGPEKAPAPVAAQGVAQAPRAVAPGSLLVHVDTKTHQLSLEPGSGTVPLELSADILNALDTSFDGLTPERRGENTKWGLSGRYRGVWLAVTDAEGKTRPFCVTSLPQRVAEAAQAVRQQARGAK
jgi:hypothetical protein